MVFTIDSTTDEIVAGLDLAGNGGAGRCAEPFRNRRGPGEGWPQRTRGIAHAMARPAGCHGPLGTAEVLERCAPRRRLRPPRKAGGGRCLESIGQHHHGAARVAHSQIGDQNLARKTQHLDANYFDATLNLGSGILNNGIDLYNKANTLPANKQKEYDAAMKAAFVEFDRAFPYLDKAVKIDPKSLNALQNLKTYYVIKKNTAKVAELTKQISAL